MAPAIAEVALNCTDSIFFTKILRSQKALYIVSNDFLGKLCLSFFVVEIPVFTFKRALSICCLKLSLS